MNDNSKTQKEFISPLKRALDLSTNKFVSACAGAGKTFALSKRYCAILDDFAVDNADKTNSQWLGVKNILVITFTKKAAAEMAGRIYTDLNTLINDNEIGGLKEQGITLGENIRKSSDKYKRWLRATFSENNISTIDGFCTKILRENADKIGIDPKFKVFDEIQSVQIFTETLDDFINEKSRDFDENLKDLLNNLTIFQIKNYLKYFYHNRAFLHDWISFIRNKTAEIILQEWTEDYLPKADFHYIKSQLELILSFEKSYVNKTDNDKGKNKFIRLRELLSNTSSAEIYEANRTLTAEILPLFLTAKRTYFSSRIPWLRGNFSDNSYVDFKSVVTGLCDFLRENLPENEILKVPNKYDIRAIPVLKNLLNFFDDFTLTLSKKQKELNYINFNDIILMTNSLLEDKNISLKYAQKFKHIMVDEFQDTNDIRWNIIKKISDSRDSGLFIVGDKKQSIYRFNQADVEVMNKAEKELTEHADHNNIVIKFNDNFRASDPYISHVINHLFPKIMSDSKISYEAEFEPTIFNKNNQSDKIVADCTKKVCDIQAVFAEDSSSEDLKKTSAENAAVMVKKLLKWVSKNNFEETPVIGVLLRKFTNIQNYLTIFREQDIPFEIVGGKGLFLQQEAFDLLHLVCVLLNPNDDIAIVGLLRSPLFAASDKIVNKISGRQKGQSIYQFISSSKEFEPIVATLTNWQKLAAHNPVDVLLTKIISCDLTLLGYYSEVGGKQRIANIYKVINLIREFSLEGSSLQNLYEFLSYQVKENKDASQAELPATAQVQILSIHRSKGLEFSAVVLPELNSAPKNDSSSAKHGRIRSGGRIELGISLTEEGESKKMNLLEAIKKQSAAEEKAENKRLFYVAVTRAKYRIAFLAEFNKKQNNSENFWNNFVRPTYNIPLEFNKDQWQVVTTKTTSVELLSQPQIQEKLSSKKHLQKLAWTDPPIFADKLALKKVTPHDLMENIPQDFTSEKSENITELGMSFGSVFHKIMEEDWWKDNSCTEKARTYAQQNFPDLQFEEISDELTRQITDFKNNELYPILNALQTEKFTELPVFGRFSKNNEKLLISGVIDLLYKHNNNWFVLDYKTDSSLINKNKYEAQVQTYLHIVKQLYGISAVGQIYFSAFGKLISVHYDESFLQSLELDKDFENANLVQIKKLIGNSEKKNLLIVNPSIQQNYTQMLYLFSQQLLTPNIRFTAFSNLSEQNSCFGRKLSKTNAELLITKITEYQNLTNGTIELLTDAILKNEKHSIGIRSDYADTEKKFKQEKAFNNYYTEADELRNFNADLSDTTVILNGFFKETPADFEFMKMVANKANDFYFINNFADSKIEKGFSLNIQNWLDAGNLPSERIDQQCTICFSVQQEVKRAAKEITSIENWHEREENIKVAVSSMERYIPVINHVFDDFGIPFFSSQKVSVLRFPIIQLILDYLKMFEKPHLKWNDIFAFLLNPLAEASDKIQQLNSYLRKTGIYYLDQSVSFDTDFAENKETYDEIRSEFSALKITDHTEVISIVSEVISKYELRKHKNNRSCTALDIFEKELDEFVQLNSNLNIRFEISDFLRNFKKHLLSAELPLRNEKKGIEIVGLLDTLNIPVQNLFVLGFTEGDFPIITAPNPFLNTIQNNKWSISLLLLNYWKTLGKKVCYFAPLRDIDGSGLQPSTFTEFLNIEKYSDIPTNSRISRTAHFEQYYGNQLETKMKNNILLRHNKMLNSEISEFKGLTEKAETNELRLSASKADKLMQCPMKFWFASKLKLKPAEFNEATQTAITKGNILHKSLQKFGEDNGFKIAQTDMQKGCILLDNTLSRTFREENTNPDKNLLQQELYRIFRDGLRDGDASNILVRLLEWNKDKLADFDEILCEQSFGLKKESSWKNLEISDNGIVLSFGGIIDKVLKDNTSKSIIATDYKTGAIDPKDAERRLSSQMIIYSLALKQNFPDFEVSSVYEKLKSMKKDGYGLTGFFRLETEDMLQYSHKRTSFEIDLTEMKEHLLKLSKQALDGLFPVAIKSRQIKACKYCEYEMICRKSTYQ